MGFNSLERKIFTVTTSLEKILLKRLYNKE
jgi:hypothetical protein